MITATLVLLALAPSLAPSAAASAEWGGKSLVVEGSTTVGPIVKAFKERFRSKYPDVSVEVSESGSGNGAKSLINGTCDVATMSRFMKENEFRAAVTHARPVFPVAHVVAIDGIAVVVHPSNPVRNLTLEQLRDIYLGKVNNWKEVGGPNVKIVKISRDTNSGTYECFEELVLSHAQIAADTEYVGSNGAVRQRVQSTPAAIGYVGLGFVDSTLKSLTVNGIAATRATAFAGTYPISRPLFLFTNGYPKLGTPLHAFVTFHLSREGEELIDELGFVPVTNCVTEEGP